LTEEQNKIANYIFSQNNTWKDEFWQTYFQPEKRLTRWEWAYLLSSLSSSPNIYLTLK
jgi:hypothetical protein